MSSTLKKLSSRLVLAQLSARVSTACWICTRTRTTPNGYARFWNQAKKKETVVHRTLYEELRGPIPEGLVLDHLCRVRLCVNPWHTEAVTVQLNTLRGGAALFGKMPATIRQWSPEADDYIIVQRQQGADWLAISQSLGVTRYQVIERYRKLRASQGGRRRTG